MRLGGNNTGVPYSTGLPQNSAAEPGTRKSSAPVFWSTSDSKLEPHPGTTTNAKSSLAPLTAGCPRKVVSSTSAPIPHTRFTLLTLAAHSAARSPFSFSPHGSRSVPPSNLFPAVQRLVRRCKPFAGRSAPPAAHAPSRRFSLAPTVRAPPRAVQPQSRRFSLAVRSFSSSHKMLVTPRG